ncbi:MAG: COG4315 family predicted lipoprotein [Dermatophilaceae bacterium]
MNRTPRHLIAGLVVLTSAGVVAAGALVVLDRAGLPAPARAAAVAVAAAPSSSPTTTPSPTPPAAPPQLRIATATAPKQGRIVVDGSGMTLYLSGKDSTSPPQSRCAGACLKTWRPVLAGGRELVAVGLPRTALGTITRADGTTQVTVNGSPAYRFTKDRVPGDITGNCKAGFVVIKVRGTAM